MQGLDYLSWAACCFLLCGLFCKKLFIFLFRLPPLAFAGVAEFLTATGNMLVHGIKPWCKLGLHPKDLESVLLAKYQLSQDINHTNLPHFSADVNEAASMGKERRRHYYFWVLQALKYYTKKNLTDKYQKTQMKPKHSNMVSCIPIISRCWSIKSPWRLQGGMWLAGAMESSRDNVKPTCQKLI